MAKRRVIRQLTPTEQRNAWAPKLALAGRYRATADRYMVKAASYRQMAEALEAEAEIIRERSA